MLCVSVVGTALILVALNAWMNPGGISSRKTLLSEISDEGIEAAYAEGYNAARDRFRTAAFISFDPSIKQLTGTVVKNGSGKLVVKQTNLDTDPVVDGVSDERTVKLAADAKVYKETPKTSEQMNKELASFNTEKEGVEPPSPYTRTSIKLSDIPTGATVRVTTDSPVRLLEQITATEIVYVK